MGKLRYLASRAVARVPPGTMGHAAAIFKVLLGYCQVLDTFRRFQQVTWPPIVDDFLKLLSYINLDLAVLPLNCIFGHAVHFYARLLATLMVPLFGSFCIFSLAALTAVREVKQLGSWERLRETVAAACVILAASSRASSARSSECADMPLLAKRDAPSDSSSPAAPALGAPALLWPSAKAVVMLL